MKLLVIGAGGFIGQEVVRQALQRDDIHELHLLDHFLPSTAQMPSHVHVHRGDFADPALRNAAIDGADAVIFLAAILGGAAEQDYTLARRVNLDLALDLAEDLKGQNPRIRFVAASTIAAYGPSLPDPVTDATPLAPTMIYGAQKVMMEVALSNFSAKGWLDAVSLRPSGVMARDGADAGLKSAFMSRLFWAVRRGQDITIPVAPESRSWLSSVRTVADNFLHAAFLPELGTNRAFTLPALALTFGELVEALHQRFPDSTSRVTFAPDPMMIALFGGHPTLVTETADNLGFRRDANARELIDNALNEQSG